MGFRFSSLATGLLVAFALALMSSLSWAVYYELGPSKDEWGLKFEGAVTTTADGKLNVSFTLGDQGRLRPIHSVHVFALSPPRPDGSRTYLLKAPMALRPTQDGRLAGQVQIGPELLNLAVVRIFSYTVDGQPQRQGVRYYDIPITRFLRKAAVAGPQRSPSPVASPPALNAVR